MNKKYIKYGTPFVKLAEECSEVIQACMKIERFGLNNYHPTSKITNIAMIESEMADVIRSIKNVRKFIKKETKNEKISK